MDDIKFKRGDIVFYEEYGYSPTLGKILNVCGDFITIRFKKSNFLNSYINVPVYRSDWERIPLRHCRHISTVESLMHELDRTAFPKWVLERDKVDGSNG
mgnify:CR=1 FL=1